MEFYTFINKEFLEVNESTKEINIISFNSGGTVSLTSKIIYQDQLEFDYILGLLKRFDSEVKDFVLKNEYNPLYSHGLTEPSKYKNEKDKVIEISSMGLDIVNKLTEVIDKNRATIKFIDGDPDYFFKRWSFRLLSIKKIFETL